MVWFDRTANVLCNQAFTVAVPVLATSVTLPLAASYSRTIVPPFPSKVLYRLRRRGLQWQWRGGQRLRWL